MAEICQVLLVLYHRWHWLLSKVESRKSVFEGLTYKKCVIAYHLSSIHDCSTSLNYPDWSVEGGGVKNFWGCLMGGSKIFEGVSWGGPKIFRVPFSKLCRPPQDVINEHSLRRLEKVPNVYLSSETSLYLYYVLIALWHQCQSNINCLFWYKTFAVVHFAKYPSCLP